MWEYDLFFKVKFDVTEINYINEGFNLAKEFHIIYWYNRLIYFISQWKAAILVTL